VELRRADAGNAGSGSGHASWTGKPTCCPFLYLAHCVFTVLAWCLRLGINHHPIFLMACKLVDAGTNPWLMPWTVRDGLQRDHGVPLSGRGGVQDRGAGLCAARGELCSAFLPDLCRRAIIASVLAKPRVPCRPVACTPCAALGLLLPLAMCWHRLILPPRFSLFLRQDSYMRDPWNIMDFVIVCTSTIRFANPDLVLFAFSRSLPAAVRCFALCSTIMYRRLPIPAFSSYSVLSVAATSCRTREPAPQ
jgi:hypothetical protein